MTDNKKLDHARRAAGHAPAQDTALTKLHPPATQSSTDALIARFRVLLDAAPDAMIIVSPDGRILQVNAQTLRLFGYTREELCGRSVEILLPVRFREIHSQHRAGYITDPHVRPMGAGLELFGLRKEGGEFPVEISLSPLDTEEGGLVIAAVRDVSERKRTEEALRTSEQKFRKVFEEGPLGIALVNPDYRFAHVNSRFCELLGYSEEELRGRTVWDITHPEDIEADREQARRVFLGEIPHYIVEKRYITKGGEVTWDHL